MKALLPYFSPLKLLFLLIFLLSFWQTKTCKAAADELDSLTLVGIYLAYNGEDWYNDDGWLKENVPLDDWYGVTLDANGRVIELVMPNNNITAEFPEQVSNKEWLNKFFTDLFFTKPLKLIKLISIINSVFDLPGNPLGDLQVLNLSGNKISGHIPEEIDEVLNLRILNFSHNSFDVAIQPELGKLRELEVLNLSYNEFSGGIPSELGNISSLKVLDLQENELTGGIPSELGKLLNLDSLVLNNNGLSGTIPDELYDLSKLSFLKLRRNDLSGSISNKLGQLSNLQHLDISVNQFSGTIPDVFQNLPLLKTLHLHVNKFEGDVPASIGQLNILEHLKISENLLVNLPDLLNIAPEFWCYKNYFTFEDFELNLKLSNLANSEISPQFEFGEERELWAPNGHPYSFSIPAQGQYNHYTWFKDGELYSKSEDSETLHFPAITFSDAGDYFIKVRNDSVPNLELVSKITTLKVTPQCVYADSLALVALYNATDGPNWNNNENWLSAPVKSWFGINGFTPDGCNVTIIKLDDNNLSGSLPIEIGNLPELKTLNLNENQLTGTIPNLFEQLSKLSYLNLGSNQLTGEIPIGLCNLFKLNTLNLSNNQLSGAVPTQTGNLTELSYLNLNGNEFSGEIPTTIEQLSKLSHIDLGNNQLTGEIPNELGGLNTITKIILSGNSFTGNVPENIGQLPNLKNLQIDNNQLENLPALNNIQNQFTCENNYFTFDDFEHSIDLYNKNNVTRTNAPQFNFENEITITITEGNPLTISRLCGGSQNHYTWWKDDVRIDVDSPDLSFLPVQLSDAGTYWVSVISDFGFDDLELLSNPIHLVVEEHCLKNDSLVLVALYNATDGPNWSNNKNWLSGLVKNWYGINGLTPDGCNVTEIQLENNNLNGLLPGEITSLGFLSSLKLGENNIEGQLPENIGQLTNLEVLTLNENSISGTLPQSIWNLQNLKMLDISNNQLSGTLSAQIENLSKLKYFNIANNAIGGILPAEIKNLDKLETFNIEKCAFRGNVSDLSSIRSLAGCNIASNKFLFGNIDAALVNEQNVEFIYAPQDTILPLEYTYETRKVKVLDDKFKNNAYQWYFNDSPQNEKSDELTISDKGMVYCHITNKSFPNLTLYSDTLNIDNVLPEFDDIIPVNLVIIDGAHSPLFTASNIELYPDNSLAVFTRWGNKIFEKIGYNNELDFSNYTTGTYYYVLKYQKPDGAYQIKSFVNVVKE